MMYRRLIFLALVFSVTAGVASGSTLGVNFQSQGSPIPPDYLPDYGEPYGDRGNGFSYGWDRDIKVDTRDRNNGSSPDQRYDTLNHLQKGADAIWEIELPNGTYDIHLVCGDPSNTDQIDNFDVEGTVVEDPDGEDNFDEYNVTIELTDGRLTIMPAAGADNCKICFVDMTSDALTAFFSKARNPDPADGAQDVTAPLLQWTAGDTAVAHRVYVGTSATLTEADFVMEQAWTLYWHAPGFTEGTTYYWRIDEVAGDGTIVTGDVWSFVAMALTAWDPRPADGATDVMVDIKLAWKEGQSATPLRHHVFFGTDEAAVADGTGGTDKGIQQETTYDPGMLLAETTYYFRVNEVESDGTEREGKVWSFETVAAGPGKILREWWFDISGEAVANLTGNSRYPDDPDGQEFVYVMQAPPNWAEQFGSRLRGWLFVPETGDYTFEIDAQDEGELRLSTDQDPANAVSIAYSDDAPVQSPPQSLVGGERYYIEALMKENTIGDRLIVSWRGPGIPTMEIISAEYVGPSPYLPEKAYGPSPADGATDIPDTVTLSWLPGIKASQHEVYFGTDEAAVAAADSTTPGIYRGLLSATSYLPAESPLEFNQTYYWKVNEKNTDGTVSLGKVWSFTVADYVIVDNFEDYNDFSLDRIFQTWIDGFGYTDPPPGRLGNGTGSTIGYLSAPFAEQTIVHGGAQSMPYGFDLTAFPFYAEAEREFPVAQNFTRKGVKSLSLWVYGDPNSAAAPLYVGLQDTAGTRIDVPDTSDSRVQTTSWQELYFELSKFAPVNLMSVKKIYIGVGNRLSPSVGGTGNLFVDDIRLYGPRCVASLLKPEASFNDDCIVDYLDLEIMAQSWLETDSFVPTESLTGPAGARWQFDGNTSDSAGSSHGTAAGLLIYAAGHSGQAIEFDGVDDYITVTDNPAVEFTTGSFSIAFWIKSSHVAGSDKEFVICNGTNGTEFDTGGIGPNGRASGKRYAVKFEGSDLRLVIDDDVTKSTLNGPSDNFAVGDWVHVVVVRDTGAGELRMYRNGLLENSGPDNSFESIASPGEPLHIGAKYEENAHAVRQSLTPLGHFFVGMLDDVQIFNYALSDGQAAYVADDTPGDGELYIPLTLPVELYDAEPEKSRSINFKDYAELADTWLDVALWPAP
ncbi:MAG: hypothetical protein JSU70_16390 [Phycisphaerales bacterium]|nr:MAG: hypothetical protein JSU70_16390 [Phycisphaerales bacterium]